MTEAHTEAASANPVTARAILLGTLSAVFLVSITPYLDFVRRTWSVGSGSLLEGSLVALFAFVLVSGLLVRLVPTAALGGFTLALMAAMFCPGALLRKDWMERQRLTFPPWPASWCPLGGPGTARAWAPEPRSALGECRLPGRP